MGEWGGHGQRKHTGASGCTPGGDLASIAGGRPRGGRPQGMEGSPGEVADSLAGFMVARSAGTELLLLGVSLSVLRFSG